MAAWPDHFTDEPPAKALNLKKHLMVSKRDPEPAELSRTVRVNTNIGSCWIVMIIVLRYMHRGPISSRFQVSLSKYWLLPSK